MACADEATVAICATPRTRKRENHAQDRKHASSPPIPIWLHSREAAPLASSSGQLNEKQSLYRRVSLLESILQRTECGTVYGEGKVHELY